MKSSLLVFVGWALVFWKYYIWHWSNEVAWCLWYDALKGNWCHVCPKYKHNIH